jgi:hypothetical protein
MSTAKKRLWIVAGVLVLAWVLVSWLVVIRPISGRVVDATTGQPVTGAVVTGAWIVKHMGFQEATYGDPYRIIETTTDQNGRYSLPGWFGIDPHGPLTSRATTESPRLYIFAPNYDPRTAANARSAHTLMVRRSLWNGKDIALTPASGTTEIGVKLRHFQLEIEQLGRAGCSWENVARLLNALWDHAKGLGLEQTINPSTALPQIRQCRQEKAFEQDARA